MGATNVSERATLPMVAVIPAGAGARSTLHALAVVGPTAPQAGRCRGGGRHRERLDTQPERVRTCAIKHLGKSYVRGVTGVEDCP